VLIEGGTTGPSEHERRSVVRGWINCVGAAVLVVLGVFLYTVDADFPTAGTPILALPLVIAGLIWGGLALRRQLTSSHNEEDPESRVR
jgi:hypothetical protein